jgi:hypothetical protein
MRPPPKLELKERLSVAGQFRYVDLNIDDVCVTGY